MAIDWDNIPDATKQNKRAADLLIRTSDGQERRTGYDGGWLVFADGEHPETNKQSISAGTETLLSVDGLGANTNSDYARGVPLDVWEANTLQPQATGEVYNVIISFKLSKASSTQTFVHLAGKIGASYTVSITDERKPLTKGSGITDFLTFTKTIAVDNHVGLNGLRFFLTFDEVVEIWDKAIFIQRTHSP